MPGRSPAACGSPARPRLSRRPARPPADSKLWCALAPKGASCYCDWGAEGQADHGRWGGPPTFHRRICIERRVLARVDGLGPAEVLPDWRSGLWRLPPPARLLRQQADAVAAALYHQM